MPVRRALGIRTLFNLVGPLANPAKPTWQLLGVYDETLCAPMAETLKQLGCRAATVVHGGGLDEVALHAPTTMVHLRDGVLSEEQFSPEQIGIAPAPIDALRGGDPQENARWFGQALMGKASDPQLAAIALNAGALLWTAGRADTLQLGYQRARAALAAGSPGDLLERWATLSQAPA